MLGRLASLAMKKGNWGARGKSREEPPGRARVGLLSVSFIQNRCLASWSNVDAGYRAREKAAKSG